MLVITEFNDIVFILVKLVSVINVSDHNAIDRVHKIVALIPDVFIKIV